MTLATAPRGQLFVWTGVDPEHEVEFNRWYDREHMQERVAIPGFHRARRFRAVGDSARPYLALYDTESLDVFRSASYREAFERQTAWSKTNFARMRGTRRRVGEIVIDLGSGEGGALALFVMPELHAAGDEVMLQFQALLERDHVIRATLVRSDVALSTPLSATDPPATPDLVALVEATEPEAAAAAAVHQAGKLAGSAGDGVHPFRSLWTLRP